MHSVCFLFRILAQLQYFFVLGDSCFCGAFDFKDNLAERFAKRLRADATVGSLLGALGLPALR